MASLATAFNSLWEIGTVDSDGQVINQLKDLVFDKRLVLVTNIALESKHADMNYRSLVELYEKYRDNGFEILAFPSN